jgi:xanthine/uracil permease
VFLGIGLVAIAKDKSRWATAGLAASLITFALWAAAVLLGGFG